MRAALDRRGLASGLVAVGDAAAREIVRRDFHRHAVTFENADAEPAQLARDGREHLGAIVQRHAERRARQNLGDGSFELDQIFLGDGASPWCRPVSEAESGRTRLTDMVAGVQHSPDLFRDRAAFEHPHGIADGGEEVGLARPAIAAYSLCIYSTDPPQAPNIGRDMRATVRKWGNSLALRIPAGIAEDAHLSDGTEVDVAVDRGRLVVHAVPHELSLEALLAEITRHNLHGEQDADAARGAEAW